MKLPRKARSGDVREEALNNEEQRQHQKRIGIRLMGGRGCHRDVTVTRRAGSRKRVKGDLAPPRDCKVK